MLSFVSSALPVFPNWKKVPSDALISHLLPRPSKIIVSACWSKTENSCFASTRFTKQRRTIMFGSSVAREVVPKVLYMRGDSVPEIVQFSKTAFFMPAV
ncbi:hypothetical protein CKO31_17305 [Thiohalocapsa halophila]|uniref:Uncharacterized protein n=1 Tax=Thiohalocapsa halophila TaxID=69359 RepID=A0ABS1CKL6_9GAMM|nr:hypothetical protein [Thiohalocapsa halophila]